jgi:hypothetical protein
MSTEAITSSLTPPLTLGQYITALINALGATHPTMLARMRLIVGDRRARIILDDEAVEVVFSPEGLKVQPVPEKSEVSGEGATDTATVLELLNGYLEVTDAILNGQLHVFGIAEDVVRMFIAIEILLDASPRTPALQDLASKLLSDRRDRSRVSTPGRERALWYPFSAEATEIELLDKLDLLPNAFG